MVIEVDRHGLAALLGVTSAHVGRLVGEGMPTLEPGGGRGRRTRFDATAALVWWRTRQAVTPVGGAGPRQRNDYLEALTQRVQQDLAVKRGDLVSRDAVLLAGQHYTKAWAGKVRALPRRLVEAGVLSREQEPVAAKVCRDLLVEISGWKTIADTRKAAGRQAPIGRRKGRTR